MSCAACGSGALRAHLRVRPAEGEPLVPTTDRYGHAPADLVRCIACGHVQVERFPGGAELGDAYGEAEDLAYAAEEAGQRATAVLALRRIERHVDPAALLDVGCWLGFMVSEAGRRGWRASGLEPSRHAVRFARERLGVDVEEGMLGETELPAGGFRAVVLADVLEHLPDPVAALGEVRRVLEPDGVVYLALPDMGSAVARALGSRWWSVLPTHVHYFSRRSAGTALARAGFEVVWAGTAPKAFSVAYYAGRVGGYSPWLARAGVGLAAAAGVADRLVAPDFRDRMAIVARSR